MKLVTIEISRWADNDRDLAGLRLKNAAGQTSDILGFQRHTWESFTLRDQPIQSITVIKKTDDNYTRGFKILYRSGVTDVINSDAGNEAGTIEFEEHDELVGMTVCTMEDEKRPRKFGFSIMKNSTSEVFQSGFPAPPQGFQYKIHQSVPVGNDYTFVQAWPTPEQLNGAGGDLS